MGLRYEEGKVALVFGVTGQDGSFLAEELLKLGYTVHGVKRRTSGNSLGRLAGALACEKFHVHLGDVSDFSSVSRIITTVKPDYIYNLAAQSHVGTSFNEPFASLDITLRGCLNILETIRLFHPCKMYQASSSEMFGNSFTEQSSPIQWISDGFGQMMATGNNFGSAKFQNEHTKMEPCSPYAIAKLAAHNLVRIYRDGYAIWACGGILFNHESERRGEEFVTRKITKYIARLYHYFLGTAGFHHPGLLRLGNIDSQRDWGYALDYVRAMILMTQAADPKDYVVATGETHTIRDFLSKAFECANIANPDKYFEIDTNLIRPCDLVYLKGDASKIKIDLGWKPTVNFDQLVEKMVLEDINDAIQIRQKD